MIAGARKAVIQSSPAALRSAVIRAWVIMPRSPTRTTWSREKLFKLGRLAGEGHRVSGIAGEHLDRHRTAVRSAQETIDDLPFAALAVTVVAKLGKPAATAFQIARRDVVEHQGATGEMAFGKHRLDRWLAHQKPVECAVEFVLIDHPETQLFAKGRGRCLGRKRAGGGELGAGTEDAIDDEGEDEVAAAVARGLSHSGIGANQLVKADLARGAEHGGDMTVRQRPPDGYGVLVRGNDSAALEQHLEAGDPLGRPVRQVQQGAFLDPAGLTIALAQQDGGGRAAIGNRLDIHGDMIPESQANSTKISPFTWLPSGPRLDKTQAISTTYHA